MWDDWCLASELGQASSSRTRVRLVDATTQTDEAETLAHGSAVTRVALNACCAGSCDRRSEPVGACELPPGAHDHAHEHEHEHEHDHALHVHEAHEELRPNLDTTPTAANHQESKQSVVAACAAHGFERANMCRALGPQVEHACDNQPGDAQGSHGPDGGCGAFGPSCNSGLSSECAPVVMVTAAMSVQNFSTPGGSSVLPAPCHVHACDPAHVSPHDEPPSSGLQGLSVGVDVGLDSGELAGDELCSFGTSTARSEISTTPLVPATYIDLEAEPEGMDVSNREST